MPAFTAVGAYVAGTLLGLAGTAAIVVGAIVATGAAYVTSRIINGNPNKGNNSASTQGGRIQVPPATNNKIPVVYGSAYVNGIITDARLKSLGGTNNDTMYYCLVLSEYTNNLTTPSYGIESVVWNDLRLTAVDTTTSAHKVKDGRKVVDGAVVTAGAFVTGTTYIITKRGNTDFTLIGAQTNNVGQIFTATGAGSGTGQAQEEDFIDTGFIVDNNSLVELRVYAGGSGSANQIYPAQSTGNTADAYTFWGNNDGSWTSANEMKGLVFAIVKMTYATNGFTSLPNVTFQLANNVANPADVWYDFMTSKRYGAGIPAADIDSTARTAWYNYCAEDINYISANLDPAGGPGTADQITERYQINGVLDTSNQVKTNIDTILQNGGAWMSYNVATGLWSPVIKKAVTAGVPGDTTTYFTASRTGTTLTVTSFPNGRIEPGQNLYNGAGTFIGSISSQSFPLLAGETTGQIGRYTTSTSGSGTTTFYTTQPTTGTLSFSDDNIISGINISSTRLEDLYNKVEVEFYDKYNKDQKAYYRTTVPNSQLNPNEPDNTLRMSLDLCNNSVQSDLLGQIELRQSRDDLVIEFTSNHYGIQTQAGDVIQVTSDLYGWAPKLFRAMRVKEQETEEGGLVAQIQALEFNPDAYTIESISEFSTAANIKIGNLISSVGLPPPTTPIITNPNPNASVPNFRFNINVPATGGPFDEAEIYYTEGWDPLSFTGSIVPGTGSNGAPVGDGLLTVTAITYGAMNVGDYFTMGGTNFVVLSQVTNNPVSKTFVSGGAPGAFTVTLNNTTGLIIGNRIKGTGLDTNGALITTIAGSQITLDEPFSVQATGTYNVFGGLGTYVVDTSATKSSTTVTLYDEPLDTDFVYLKKIVPDGNATAFVSPSTISVLITELPANTQTYRRYFLKARLGNKKNFGAFSPNTPFDIDGNNVKWTPNPTAAGRFQDLTDVDVSTKTEGDTLYYDATTSKWKNTNTIQIIDNDVVPIARVNGLFSAIDTSVEDGTHSFVNTRTVANNQVGVITIDARTTGTATVGFGPSILASSEIADGSTQSVGGIAWAATDMTAGSEDFQIQLSAKKNGALPDYKVYIDSDGNISCDGNLTLNFDQTAASAVINAYSSTALGTQTWNGTNWTISNDVIVSGDLTVTGTNINTGVANTIIEIDRTTTATTGSARALILQTTSTGTPAVDFGTALEFSAQTGVSNFERAAFIDVRSTDITAGSEDFKMSFGLMAGGTTYTDKLALYYDGNLVVLPDYNNTTTPIGIQGPIAASDFWFVGGNDPSGTGSNNGAMIIASGNNGNEPIYVRQYTGGSTALPFPGTNTVATELTLLDANGDTKIPGTLILNGDRTIQVPNAAPNEVLSIKADICDWVPNSTATGTPNMQWDATEGLLDIQTSTFSTDGDITASGLTVINTTTLNNDIVRPLELVTNPTSAPTVGSGVGIKFISSFNTPTVSSGLLDVVMTDATVGSNDFEYSLSLRQNGTMTEVTTISSQGDITATGYVQTRTYSVSQLPTASAALQGARAFVDDSSTAVFNAVVTSGGSNLVPVFCTGSQWRVG